MRPSRWPIAKGKRGRLRSSLQDLVIHITFDENLTLRNSTRTVRSTRIQPSGIGSHNFEASLGADAGPRALVRRRRLSGSRHGNAHCCGGAGN